MRYARIFKLNPYHDEKGRFAPKEGSRAAFVEMATGRTPTGGKNLLGYPEYRDNAADHVAERVKMTQPEWDSLTDKEKFTVIEYTKNDFGKINRLLTGTSTEAEAGQAITREKVAVLDGAIAKGSLPENTVLYRGSKAASYAFPDAFSGKVPLETLIGQSFSDPTFGSSSYSADVGKSFSNTGKVLLRINAPAGTRGLVLGDSEARTGNRTEAEVLLSRNLRYTVRGVTYVNASKYSDHKIPLLEVDLL